MRSAVAIGVKELRLLLLSGAGLASAITCMGAAIFVCGTAQMEPPIASYRLVTVCGSLLSLFTIVLMAGAAQRDTLSHCNEIVLTRPYSLDKLIAVRCLAGAAGIVIIWAASVTVGVLAYWLLGGGRLNLVMGWDTFIRYVTPLVFLAIVSYCFTWLMRNHLAAAVVALYWIAVLLGGTYVGHILDFSLTQNAPLYWVLAAGFLLVTAAVARVREGIGRPVVKLELAATVVLLASFVLAYQFEIHRHDPPFHMDLVTLNMGVQHAPAAPRAPGFWLPDQHGRTFRLSLHDDRPLVIAFWSPQVAESAQVLPLLQEVQRRWGDRVLPIAICIANDFSYARHAAREMGLTFPMLVDTGTHLTDTATESAPLAGAYDLAMLPSVFVTDSQRRLLNANLLLSIGSPLRLQGSRLQRILQKVLGE